MANLTREEVINRGYVTDPFVVNSNVDVDSELFKAAITDRFYYDLIYGDYKGNDEKTQIESVVKEKVIEIQEPTTVVIEEITTEPEVVEQPVAEEPKEEVIETPVEPEKKSKKSTKKVEEVAPVEPVVEETKE
jgi:hypothetical protein